MFDTWRSLHPMVGFRRWLVRHPWLRWAVIVLSATVAGSSAATRYAELDAARQAWATGATVLVTRVAVEAGRPVTRAEVVERNVPPDAVPNGALTLAELPDPGLVPTAGGPGAAATAAGQRRVPALVARVPLVAGEIVAAHQLTADPAGDGVIGPDDAALAVPLPVTSRPPLDPGDRVGVVVAADPVAVAEVVGPVAPTDGGDGWLADGTVIALTDDAVTVVVPRGTVDDAVNALAAGRLAVVLLGEPGA